jgi:FMN-dependent NADH-azoreductase
MLRRYFAIFHQSGKCFNALTLIHQESTMNKTLLQLNASIYSSNGQSTRLGEELVSRWRADNPGGAVLVRDLATNPLPHLTLERFQAFITNPAERTPAQQTIIAESDALIEELARADVIVLGLPMYNFGVPSTLKAYFDHVARAGVTFRYTAQGSLGLLTGKKAYVIATRGGLYAGTPADNETAYVRQFLGFLGITDVEFVYAEGLAISEASKAAGIAQARQAIGRVSEAALEPLAA